MSRRYSASNPPRDGRIYAAMLGEGTGNYCFHALRENGNAACSSYLDVQWVGHLASNIEADHQCRTKACQRLFKLAAPTLAGKDGTGNG